VRVLNRFKVAKYFEIKITDTSVGFCRDKDSSNQDAVLDGFYVIRTSGSAEDISARETVEQYKGLSKPERGFKSLKALDLKVRPIFHRLEKRVRAHVFLCMLAYYVEWHMRKALASMLFDDEHEDEAQAQRSSVVAKARRSPQAQAKAQRGLAEDGTPGHSFKTLLGDLGTLCRNTIRLKSTDAVFTEFTTPTRIQDKAFKLLGVSHIMWSRT
jgi:hypothetical protein